MDGEIFGNLEVEEVNRSRRGFGMHHEYPVCHVGDTHIVFNAETQKILPMQTKAIKWFTNNEYVVILPTVRGDRNAYIMDVHKGGRPTRTAFIPAALVNEKKLPQGYRRLYKYKNGVAFKRYETINAE